MMNDGETSQDIMTEGIFDGEPDLNWDEDVTEGDGTEAQEAPQETDAKEQAADDAEFLTIRHNKQEVKLSKAEAVELAQKGKNYDHVFGELQSYREGAIGRAMKLYADEAGMSVEQYAEMMIQNQEAAAEKQALEQLEEQHPDWPEDALRELVKAQRAGAKEKAKSAEELKRQQEWAEARAAYPDITPENLPKDVLDAVKEGTSPLMALREHELATLRAKVAELTSAQETKEKQNDNRARSTGSLASIGNGAPEDDFLSGMRMRSRGY